MEKAFGVPGTKHPFHGVWVIVALALGVALVVAAASMLNGAAGNPTAIENLLRVAGFLLGAGFAIALLDGSPSHFETKSRGVGLFATMALSLGACLLATAASMRVHPSSDDDTTL